MYQAESYSGIEALESMASAHNYNRHLDQLIARAAGIRKIMLDFGAGDGLHARALAEQSYSVSCVEPDAELQSRLVAAGLTVHNTLEEVNDGSIEFIYSLNVLEHIVDDEAVLRLMFRKLTSDGALLIYVPAFPLLFSNFDRQIGHVRRYRKMQLRRKIREAGFQLQRSTYVDSLGFFAALLYKVFDRSGGSLNSATVRLFDRFVFPASLVCDRVLFGLLGKNLAVVAAKPHP